MTRVRSYDPPTDGPTDEPTDDAREPGNGNAHRVASNRNHHPSKRREPHRLCCVPPTHSFIYFIHPCRLASTKKKRWRSRASTYLRGNRAADGLLRRRRALGERDEAGVQSEGNHDYLLVRAWIGVRTRTMMGRSVKKRECIRGNFQFALATLRDIVYQERNVKF